MLWWTLSAALAMSVTSRASVLASSDAGDAALIEFDADGPEGGGSVDYTVVRLGPDAAVWDQSRISDNFSPGDGSTPEHIPVSDCIAAAKHLQEALTGFKGVVVTPSACRSDRWKVVVATGKAPEVHSDHAPNGVPEGRWTTGGGDLVITLKDEGVDAWRKVGDRYEPAKTKTSGNLPL